jgi:hypothetical protein
MTTLAPSTFRSLPAPKATDKISADHLRSPPLSLLLILEDSVPDDPSNLRDGSLALPLAEMMNGKPVRGDNELLPECLFDLARLSAGWRGYKRMSSGKETLVIVLGAIRIARQVDDAESGQPESVLQSLRRRPDRHEEGAEPGTHQTAAGERILYPDPELEYGTSQGTISRLISQPSGAKIVEIVNREPWQLYGGQHTLDLPLSR